MIRLKITVLKICLHSRGCTFIAVQKGHANSRARTCGLRRLQEADDHFARGARQRQEYTRHSLCRAHFDRAHGKGRSTHFYPAKIFVVRFGKRRRTTQFFVVRNMRHTAKKGVNGRPRGDGVTPSLPCAAEHARERWYSLPCATWLGARQRVVKAHD
jgi:hypothetical protein